MLLALDPSTRLGWALGRGDTLPRIGSCEFSTENGIGAYATDYRDWLIRMIHTERVTQVVKEGAFIPAPFTDRHTGMIVWNCNAISRVVLCGMAMVTSLVCADLGVPCQDVEFSDVKMALTGNGRASKAEMIDAARMMGLQPANDDEADAAGVWVWGVHRFVPEHASRWARRPGGLL